jgi:flagellar basal body rod protein FlgB
MNNRLHLAPATADEAAEYEDALVRTTTNAAHLRQFDDLAEAVHEDLADSIPTATTRITGDTLALERVLAKRRDEKRDLQKLLSVTKAKLRQTDATIRGIEDHLDTLFESEA